MTPFNITHVKAFTSAEGAILVSYIRKVSAHFAMHLSLLVIQPHKLWKPLFLKFMSIHLCLLFIFSLWRWLFLFSSFLSVCTLNFIVSAWKKPKRKRLMIVDWWQTPQNGRLHFSSPDLLAFASSILYPVFLRQEYMCRFSGYSCIPKWSCSCIFIYLFIYYYLFFPGCFNTRNYFPNCRKPPYWQVLRVDFVVFLLSTQLILLSNGEWVSISVKPWQCFCFW